MLTIYDTTGAKRFETPINKGSKRVFKLMGDDYVTLIFSVKTPIYFKLGDYCDIPDFGRFELVEPYQPSYNNSTGGYDYELKLEAQHMKWRNKKMRYLPNLGGNETAWQLTATAAVHLEQVLLNVNALANQVLMNGEKVINQGYLYNRASEWKCYVDGTVEASAKTVSYDQTNIIDALTAIAEAFECEWWLNGNIINLGKCENTNEYIDLELGKNVADMSRSDSKEDYVTRIISFGSERNISPRYRKDLIFDVKEIQNGGNRISDTNRILSGDWFPASLVVASSADKHTFVLTGAKSGTFQANSAGDVLIFSEQHTLNNLSTGEWKIDFSNFKPSLSFDSRNGISEYRVVVSIVGVVAGSSNVTAGDEIVGYIPYDGYSANLTFKSHTFTATSDLASLTIAISYYAKFSGKGSIIASKSPGANNTITVANSYPNTQINGIVIEKIDSKGNTAATFNGAIFNPDFKDSATERNWIQLPNGSVMQKGDRFRIANIITNKVKSSYFSSRYSAYEDMENVVKNGIVTSRLMLPESHGTPYVDYKPGLSMEEGVEDVVIFEDIYPRAVCTITNVETVQRKESVENDDGSTTDKTYTAYKIKDDFFTSAHPFSNDYIVPEETLKITFQDGKRYKKDDTIPNGKKVGDLINPDSGKLNGWTFEVKFTKDDDGSAIWEIVRDNTSFIPNEILKPEKGDQFVLHGFDISAVDDLYVAEAEKELLEKTRKYLEKLNTDPSTYDCTIMPDVAKDGFKLELGTRVNLINEAYIPSAIDSDGRKWGRKSRVIGFEVCLDIPYDNPIYTIGEQPQYSRFGAIEDRIEALKYSMAQPVYGYGGAATNSSNANGVYVIGQTDITPASDTNVFSALRSKIEFLSKKTSEIINYLWTFTQGLLIGNYVPNNDGAKIDPNGDAEFNDVTIRKDANVGGNINVDNDVNVGGEITVQQGVTIGSYQPGAHGGRVWVDELGKVHIETDYIEAREKIQAKEIEIQEETHVGGCQIISPAAMRCSRVVPIYNDMNSVVAYKCFFTAEDENGTQIYNQFEVGDLAKCETFNLVRQANGMMGNHYYWRKVIETGYVDNGDADYDSEYGREGYIVLSNKTNEKEANSDAPQAGDRIITVGNDDPAMADRANLIILASYGTGSPYIYQYKGITTFALNKDNLKVAISPNGNLFTGKLVIENGSTETDVVDYIENNIYLEAYQLVLSNEMAAVPYDDNGKPIGNLPSSAITVYKGKTVEVGWNFSVDCTGCVAAIAHGTLYVSQLNDKNATVTVTATKKDCPTLAKVMTIVKVKDGEMGTHGDHAVQFEIEPDRPMVLADMDGNCDPTKLGCKVFMVIGNQNRIEVPLSNTAPVTTYASGDKLLFFSGKLFVNRPVEVDVPTDLILRYVITNQDYVTDENGKVSPVITSESEHIYTGQAITMSVRMKNIIFKLYRGNTLVDVQTVVVTTDPTAMKVVYNTRFEVTDKKIEAEASRITENSEEIANLKITADEIKSSISKTIGIIKSSNGRNLLLGTNQGVNNWGYISDSLSNPRTVILTKNEEIYAPRIGARSDATYEMFYYKLRPELIKSGEKYTLSFKIQNAGKTFPALNFFAQISNTDSTGYLTKTAYFPTTVTSGVQSMEVTLEATSTGVKNGSQVVMIGIIPENVNQWMALNFWDLKIEIGENATPYCPAPEDYTDYKYEELDSTITQTAEGIRAEAKKLVEDAEGRITEAYTSAISVKADEINSTVQALDEELGAFKSEIRQTATNISLRIDELEGYENLITGNSTGEGWKRSNESGVFEEVTPDSSGYSLTNSSQSSPKYLRTALFNLKANTEYTLQFKHSAMANAIKSATYNLKYGDSQTLLFSQQFKFDIVSVMARTVVYKFTTGDAAIENAFIEFTHAGNSQPMSTWFYIKDVMLEIGDVVHPFADNNTGLLSTGIDIYNKRIVFTSDNIIFQNNKGEQSMFIDENGQILASFINVDKMIVRHVVAGDEDGQRVEIKPDNKSIEIYDDNAELVSVFNGIEHPRGKDDLYSSSENGTVGMSASSGGYSMDKGLIRLDGTVDGVSQSHTIYSNIWPNGDTPSNSPTNVIFEAGNIYCSVLAVGYFESNSGSSSNPSMTPINTNVSKASAYVEIWLEAADDSSFTTNVKSWSLMWHGKDANPGYMPNIGATDDGNVGSGKYHPDDQQYSQGNEGLLKGKSAKSTKKGYFRLKMEITLMAKKEGSFAQVSWGSQAPEGSDLAASYRNEFYISNFFANGFCLGSRSDKYILAYKDENGNMHFEAEEQGMGFKFSDSGFMLKHNGGIWMNMPLLIFKGRATYNSYNDTYNWSEIKSYDGKKPSLAKQANTDGVITITFPSEWSALKLSLTNMIVNVSGYSTIHDGNNPNKAQIQSITSTSITVTISDDASPNDGEFLINVFKI